MVTSHQDRLRAREQELLHLLGHLFLRQGKAAKAATMLAALDTLRPGQPKVLLALALALARDGQPARALLALDQLARLGPPDAMFHLARAQALSALARRDEAGIAMRMFMAMRAHLPPTQEH